MQRLDASTSPVGVTMLRRIKLDANGSLDGSMQPRRLDAASMSLMLLLYSSCIAPVAGQWSLFTIKFQLQASSQSVARPSEYNVSV